MIDKVQKIAAKISNQRHLLALTELGRSRPSSIGG